jgi:Fur family ferric uptake transcriptional regulator
MTDWSRRLSEAGCRVTAPRRAVMQVLSKSEVPLSPQEVCERASAIHPNLGLVTVYRALSLFQELDLVRRVHHSNGRHGYVATLPGHRHHIVCQKCGRTVEFPGSEDLATLITQVEKSTSYRVDDHLLQLFGLCPDCQETEA